MFTDPVCASDRPSQTSGYTTYRSLLHVGVPWAATQTVDKCFSKPDAGGAGGFLSSGRPIIEVEAEPPISLDGFPGGKRPLGLPKSGFEKTSQSVGFLPGALLVEQPCAFKGSTARRSVVQRSAVQCRVLG